MRLLCILALAALAAHPSFAALGNDDETIDAMYGNIVKRHLRDDGAVSVIYHKDRYYFRVLFKDLRSVLEEYSRADGKDLSPKEIARFLKPNSGRGGWIEEGKGDERKWERKDRKAEATFADEDGRQVLRVKLLN